MVRSSAGGLSALAHGYDPELCPSSHAASDVLERFSSSVKPRSVISLPAVTSVRVFLFILVALMSVWVLFPILTRSNHEPVAAHSLQSVPRMSWTANLHLGQPNWRSYTLRQAAQVIYLFDFGMP